MSALLQTKMAQDSKLFQGKLELRSQVDNAMKKVVYLVDTIKEFVLDP